VRDRPSFWWRALRRGVDLLNSAAGWVTLAVLVLGAAAGIAVPLVFPVSGWLTTVAFMGLFIVVMLEGSYRVWHATDQARLSAETARDETTEELEAQRRAHEQALGAAQADHEAKLAAGRRALTGAAATPALAGLEVVITKEVSTPFPGLALILEVEYAVTNHDTMEHMLSVSAEGPSFFPPADKQRDPEYQEILYAYGRISDRRRREAPPRVRPGETVHGAYVREFAWNPARYLPDYTLVVSDGRNRYEARPGRTRAQDQPESLQPQYGGAVRYRHLTGNMTEHRIGLRNPPGNPPATGVRLEWTEMTPRPGLQNAQWEKWQPAIPSAVPRVTGGDPAIGVSLPPGREEVWVAVTTGTASDGTMSGVEFGPAQGSSRGNWHGLLWELESGGQWRLTYRIVTDNLPACTFSLVITAEDGKIECRLED
jgi:hypothetical protein